jgi:hypothetical protein
VDGGEVEVGLEREGELAARGRVGLQGEESPQLGPLEPATPVG